MPNQRKPGIVEWLPDCEIILVETRPRHWLQPALLVLVTALTRLAFRSHYLYDIDSVNFALALDRFDPTVHQPHPPGYFLYICLGRLSRLIFRDANTSFVAISIIFSCAAAVMIYSLADDWFGRNAGVFAGLVFVFSPMAWFHGTVALTYIVEAFFSALVGYLCWRIHRGSGRLAIAAAVVTGIAAGFRPSSLMFLGPLLLFSLRASGRRRAVVGIVALMLTFLAWFVPMIRVSGGTAYISSLLSLWRTVPAKETIFNSSPVNSLVRALVIAGIYLLCFGCAAILPFRGFARAGEYHRKTQFTLVWVTPGLLFFTFIFLKFVNSGYLLILFPPVCAWMGHWAAGWFENPGSHRSVKILIVAGCAAANVIVFLYAPFYFSYREVRRFENELAAVVRILPEIASPRDTLIVSFDSHFLGYRHAGYYLPGYTTVQFPEVHLASGPRIFTMRDRDTGLEPSPPVDTTRNFVLFPLPSNDAEYREYMLQVRKRFPAGDLRTIVRGGHEFAVGSTTDLPCLFPAAPSIPAATVSGEASLRAATVNNR